MTGRTPKMRAQVEMGLRLLRTLRGLTQAQLGEIATKPARGRPRSKK